jgi:hypothetical protein
MIFLKDKLYKIWLIEIYYDEGACYYYPLALSYRPEQWFADLFRSKPDDDVYIREFTTNLLKTDYRFQQYCHIVQKEDNEEKALSVQDVGIEGNIPIMCFKPILLSKWSDQEQCYLPYIEIVYKFFEVVA